MGDGRTGRAAQGLHQRAARAPHLPRPGFTAQLQHRFRQLVGATRAQGIAPALHPAQGRDGHAPLPGKLPRFGHPAAFPAWGQPGRLQGERGVDRGGVGQFKEIGIPRLDARLAAGLVQAIPPRHGRPAVQGGRAAKAHPPPPPSRSPPPADDRACLPARPRG